MSLATWPRSRENLSIYAWRLLVKAVCTILVNKSDLSAKLIKREIYIYFIKMEEEEEEEDDDRRSHLGLRHHQPSEDLRNGSSNLSHHHRLLGPRSTSSGSPGHHR